MNSNTENKIIPENNAAQNKSGKILTILLALLIFILGISASDFFMYHNKPQNSITMSMNNAGSVSEYYFGKLPKPACESILKILNSCTPVDINNPEVFNKNANTLRLNFNEDPDLALTIDDNGYAEFINDDKTEYYKINCYYKIVETVAKYLPFCDWEAMCHSKEIADIFEEFSDDMIMGTSPVDSFDSWIRLYGNDVYTVFADQYGKITIFYENEYGGTPTVTYQSTPEFYEKIKVLTEDRPHGVKI